MTDGLEWAGGPSAPTKPELAGLVKVSDLLTLGSLTREENFDGEKAHETSYLCYSSGTTGKPKGVEVDKISKSVSDFPIDLAHFLDDAFEYYIRARTREACIQVNGGWQGQRPWVPAILSYLWYAINSIYFPYISNLPHSYRCFANPTLPLLDRSTSHHHAPLRSCAVLRTHPEVQNHYRHDCPTYSRSPCSSSWCGPEFALF